jgi:hypothetical protein
LDYWFYWVPVAVATSGDMFLSAIFYSTVCYMLHAARNSKIILGAKDIWLVTTTSCGIEKF